MKLIPLAAAAAISLAAGVSLAQPAPPPGPGAPAHEGWRRPDPAQMAEQHAQHLRDVLQLRPEQEPALRALVASMQPPPGAGERMREAREGVRNLPTPQRLDRMEARMAERQTRFHARAEAIRRFYAQLTPAQQKAFDALPMMGRMGGGHGGHGGMGMGGRRHGGLRDGMPGREGGPPRTP